MKMELFGLPFEAIALPFHAVAAAAVGLWRIRAVGSAPSSLAPSPETKPSRPVRADPAPTQPSRIRPCAEPKERFTAYYGDDASYGDEEEGHVGVDGEMTAPLVGVGFVWEVNGDVRRGIYEPCPLVVLPPSDLQEHLGHPLDSREGTDVAFEVGRETFAAHRWLIAA